MIASNVMSTELVTLGREKTMLDAIKLISNKKVRQIPVLDNSNKIIGVITPRKLMKAIVPPYISEGMISDVKFAPELPEFVENIDSLAGKTVEEVLDTDFVAISPETHTMEIAALFLNAKKPVESIMVVDDQKRLLGVISPWDVFKRLWQYAEKKN